MGHVTHAGHAGETVTIQNSADWAQGDQPAPRQVELLARFSSDVVFEGTNEGILAWVSAGVRDLLGWSPDELPGQPFARLVHPEDVATVRDVQAQLLSGRPARMRVRLATRAGGWRWMDILARSVIDDEGRVSGRYGSWRDAQAQVEAEQSLREAGLIKDAMFATMADPIIVLRAVRDADGDIVDFEYLDANPAACAYNAMTRDQLVGRRMIELFPGVAEHSLIREYARVVDTGEPLTLEAVAYPSELHGGSERLFDLRATKLGDGLFYTWRDVTERVEGLRRARQVGRTLARSEAMAHLGSWTWDLDAGSMWWSDEHYRIFGLPVGEPLPGAEAFEQFVHPDDRHLVREVLERTMVTREPFWLEHRIVRPDCDVRWVRAQGDYQEAEDGGPDRLLGLVLDITEEVALRQALETSEEQYRLLAENAYDVIWTMELDGTISYVSPAVERVRGFTPEEARHQSLEEIHPPESAARVQEYFGRLLASIASGAELPTFRGEQEYFRKDGTIMVGELQVTPQVDSDGHVVRVLGVTRDVTERRRYEQELNRLTVTDSLTGVWNRRHGEELLEADLAEARRYGPPLSLLMIDIDHFKDINDTYGHQVGDLVLVELCRRLTAHLRPSDALVRWGGEEFVILARHCTLDAGAALATKIVELIASEPFERAGFVSVSIGVAEFVPDDDLASWMERADDALYDAKAAGRNTARTRA